MTLVNAPQTAPNAFYPQLNNNMPHSGPAESPQNLLQSLGLPSDLVKNLRNSLESMLHGNNPDRAMKNLMDDLKTFQTFLHSENGAGITAAQEWPADKELPANGKDFVKAADGSVKEFTTANADNKPSANDKDFVKGADGSVQEFTQASGRPGDVKHSDSTLATAADNVVLQLIKFLNAEATGTGLKSAADDLSSALQALPEQGSPEQVRAAVAEVLHSLGGTRTSGAYV